MATTTLYVNSDVSIDSWTDQSGGTSNIYQSIDEGTASPNDSDYVKTSTGNDYLYLGIQNMPSDFVSANSLQVKLRHATDTTKSAIYVQEVALTDPDLFTLVAGPTSTTADITVTTYTYNLSIVTGSNNKTTWDNALLRLQTNIGSGTASVYAVQIELDYQNVVIGSGGSTAGGTAEVTSSRGFTASGGTTAGGTASVQRFFGITGSGGTIVNGFSPVSFSDVGSGGVIINGSSESIFTVTTLGGVLLSGSLTEDGNVLNETASGGVLAAITFAPRSLRYNIDITPAGLLLGGSIEPISTGGAIAATSFAPRRVDYFIEGSGGIACGGDVLFLEIVDGGIEIAGDVETNAIYDTEGTGSILSGGLGNIFIIYEPIASAGVTVNSTATITTFYESIISGGVLANGTAFVGVTSMEVGTDGVLANGTASVGLSFAQGTTGGILIGGISFGILSLVGSGGIRISGDSNPATIVYRNFTASGQILCSSIAPIVIRYNHQPTDGVEIGGDITLELSFKPSGGLIASGTVINEAFLNVYPSGGVIIGENTLVGVVTERETNTSGTSVAVGGESNFSYSMVRALSPEECAKAIPCVHEEFEPRKPKPTQYIQPYSSCKKTVVLRGGFVAGTTVCTMGYKVRKLINDNQDKTKGPALQEAENFVETS